MSTARVVRSSDGEGTIELVVTDRSVFDIVTRAGASVQSMVANPEGSRLVIEAPVETGVRDIVDLIRSEYPNATVVAQRERDNTVSDIGGRMASSNR